MPVRNAKKYDDRITVGLIPSSEDLEQLKGLGYKTIIDLRDENERFGGLVEMRATTRGLSYISIPVARDAIPLDNVKRFYQEVYRKGSAPLYVFSRFGKKPVVFLLLFEAVAEKKSLAHIYRKAEKLGFRLQGDVSFQSFLLRLIDSAGFKGMVDKILESRPDLLGKESMVDDAVASEWQNEEDTFHTIADALLETTHNWVSTRDEAALKSSLSEMLYRLSERRASKRVGH